MTLIQRYETALFSAPQPENWQEWFSTSLSCSPSESPLEVVAEMLHAGATYWDSEPWCEHVRLTLRDWAYDGRLVMVKLMSQSLLTTAPDDLRPALLKQLCLYSAGEFASALEGYSCRWPARAENYAKHGQLNMSPIATDQASHDWADTRVTLLHRDRPHHWPAHQ